MAPIVYTSVSPVDFACEWGNPFAVELKDWRFRHACAQGYTLIAWSVTFTF